MGLFLEYSVLIFLVNCRLKLILLVKCNYSNNKFSILFKFIKLRMLKICLYEKSMKVVFPQKIKDKKCKKYFKSKLFLLAEYLLI